MSSVYTEWKVWQRQIYEFISNLQNIIQPFRN
nr:MAG TPA: hypothetical protein [Caudoviricetes sp.]